MKKVILFTAAAMTILFASCGSKASSESAEQDKADSIRAAFVADSIAAVEAAKADSIAAAEAAKADSIAAAATATKAPAAKAKTTPAKKTETKVAEVKEEVKAPAQPTNPRAAQTENTDKSVNPRARK